MTAFDRPQHIYAADVSPNDRYLLVWHMEYPPRKVSIYDIKTSQRVGHFEPGYGGRLRWAAHDLLYHHWAAGTNTAIWAVYSLDGSKQWGGFTSGAALDSSGRYVFVFPTLSVAKKEILVTDVRNGNVLGKVCPEDIACVNTWTWLDGLNVRFWYWDLDNQTKTVDIRLDPGPELP